ncbi:hypothetical protein FIV42_01275 [Persicimonas caeni]|uniref:Uncharacterized protein n=1 Tax=Persicimonas caeni TaxID=2292766 RepID=A0A4Y6PM74_PERCE|nr:hypothetical protein [Persicimonas caeni]QDG49414.1 hypothetical protein FIV42_01275 [Persicimonas caeni]QED30635.1 hypothetical protein FRD00_01270 [Persicimonas caeni]
MKRYTLMFLVALAFVLGACSDDDDNKDTTQNNTLADATSDTSTANDTSVGEDTGEAQDTGGTDDTGEARDTGEAQDTGGEDTGTADVGQDVEEDTGTTPSYCTGNSSCRGIENMGTSVPQVCNNTPGCSYDNATQECQGTPEYTDCASIKDETVCTDRGCEASGQGDSFTCAQPATNPPIQCEWFTSPDARVACTLYGCAYNGPTEGECSAPSQDYMLDCGQFDVQSQTGCESTDPSCCAYWANSSLGSLCGPQNAVGSGVEFCGPGPAMELNCLSIPVDECESREGCSLGNNNGQEYCQGRTPLRCEDLTGEYPGQEGNFSQECKAFGCDWQWTN